MNLLSRITLLFITVTTIHLNSKSLPPTTNPYLPIAATALAGYLGYTYFSTAVPFEPTLEKLNVVTITPDEMIGKQENSLETALRALHRQQPFDATITIESIKDIPEKNFHVVTGIKKDTSTGTVILFSPYYTIRSLRLKGKSYPAESAGAGLYAASRYLHTSLFTHACVTFDYPDTRATFNLGGSTNQECLNLVYENLVNQAPNKDIILVGSCRGATTILNFLTNSHTKDFSHIKAIILEAPPFSLRAIVDQEVSYYFPSFMHGIATMIAYELLYKRCIYPNYRETDHNHATLLDNLDKIPNVPLLIIGLEHDHMASNENLRILKDRLEATGHTHVILEILTDPTIEHATLRTCPEFKLKINQFVQALEATTTTADPLISTQDQMPI